jgi:hypothetical protein
MRAIILALMLAFSLSGYAKNEETPASNDGVVKKSKTGICHAPGGSYYEKTKNFTPFKTLDECLKSGGRLPKR